MIWSCWSSIIRRVFCSEGWDVCSIKKGGVGTEYEWKIKREKGPFVGRDGDDDGQRYICAC
jgi:hypothetical protein